MKKENTRITRNGDKEKGIHKYNWIHPLALFLLLNGVVHVTDLVRSAFRRGFLSSIVGGTLDVTQAEESLAVLPFSPLPLLVVSLIAGIVIGGISVSLGRKHENVREYWKRDFLKDAILFCVVYGIAQVVSLIMLEFGFRVGGGMVGEVINAIFWVIHYLFPEAIVVPFVIPGAIVYYAILGVFNSNIKRLMK